MPTIPLTLDALAGLALGVVFAFVCLRDLSRGVLWYLALGWLPFFQVATLSGNEYTTGLLPVEFLATILIAVWLTRARRGTSPAAERTPFDLPLLLLLPVAGIALVSGFLGLDPLVSAQNVKLSVSIGQIVLLAWPIGVYFVVANVATAATVDRAIRLLIALGSPAVLLPVVPLRYQPFVEWTVYFALAASPFCIAWLFQPLPVTRRAALALVAISPAVHGFAVGKALWYVVPVVAFGVIAALRARRLLAIAAPLTLGIYLLVLVPAWGAWVPREVSKVVAEEEAQQSLGGRSGRDALAEDAIRIWSRYPLFGVGPGNNYPYMIKYSVIGTPHGQYMNLLLETGLVGFACYAAFVALAIKSGLNLLARVRGGAREVLVLGWLGLFVGLVAVGGLLGDFSLPSIRNDGLHTLSWYYQQWVVLGLLAAVKRIEAS
jgi:hypothetical protein